MMQRRRSTWCASTPRTARRRTAGGAWRWCARPRGARDRCVGVLMDLAGPKIRIECFREGRVHARRGRALHARHRARPARPARVSAVGVAYKDLPQDVAAGDTLLLNDGQIVLDVVRVGGTDIDTRVRVGGELSDRKGLNRQGGGISAPALSERDREDIRFAAAEGIDYCRRVLRARGRRHRAGAQRCCAPPAAKRASSPRSSGTRRSTI